ncbi:MAG: DUF4258 domain-containing protein [Hormoscilla sp.]
MSKEIRFSNHALSKLDVVNEQGFDIGWELVIETIQSPDRQEQKEGEETVAQKRLNENIVLRVVYREFEAFILVITLYPGRRSRYEKTKS